LLDVWAAFSETFAAGPESGNAWRSPRWPFWIFECTIRGALTKLSEAFSIAGQAIYPGRRNTSSEYKCEYRCTECVLCAGGMQRNHVSRSVYINNVYARVISYRLRDAVQLTHLPTAVNYVISGQLGKLVGRHARKSAAKRGTFNKKSGPPWLFSRSLDFNLSSLPLMHLVYIK